MISSLRRLCSEVTNPLELLKVLSSLAGVLERVSEAARDHRHCLQSLCIQEFAKAAFGVMFAYSGVTFDQWDSCDERKG